MGSKKHLVHLKVPSTFLATLPVMPLPQPKQKVKKIAADEQRLATTSLKSSPAKEEPKVNSLPLKQSSTASLVSKPSSELQSTRNGYQAKKWGRSTREFKTFTGFKVSVKNWVQKDSPDIKTEPDTIAAVT